jgi:hypothetical protein
MYNKYRWKTPLIQNAPVVSAIGNLMKMMLKVQG